MREGQAAGLLLGSLLSGSAEPAMQDEGLRERLTQAPADISSPGIGWRAEARSLLQPARQETSGLRWEESDVSYAIMGRSLTREEAVDLFLSLRPHDELP